MTPQLIFDHESDTDAERAWIRSDRYAVFVKFAADGSLLVEVHGGDDDILLDSITAGDPYEPDGLLTVPGFGTSQY